MTPETCTRCGAAIYRAEGVWLDATAGEGCTSDSGSEGTHAPMSEPEPAEDGEQCINCLRYTYDPHLDLCMHCRFQMHPEEED